MDKLQQHHKEDEICPDCGELLHIRNGKQGAFLGCTAYPKCQFLRPLHERSETKKKLAGTSCPQCSHELALKQGRYGLFIGCTDYPNCQYTAQLSDGLPASKIEGNADNASDTQAPNVACPSCKKGKLIERHSRFGKLFYACDTYPICKYAVNDLPVNEFCPDCHWGILTMRKTPAQTRLICPQKNCNYKGKSL